MEGSRFEQSSQIPGILKIPGISISYQEIVSERSSHVQVSKVKSGGERRVNLLQTASELNYAIQAADLSIYCINWGFRIPSIGMDAERREEIAEKFGPWLNRLQFEAQIERDDDSFHTFGIAYVPDPYHSR